MHTALTLVTETIHNNISTISFEIENNLSVLCVIHFFYQVGIFLLNDLASQFECGTLQSCVSRCMYVNTTRESGLHQDYNTLTSC